MIYIYRLLHVENTFVTLEPNVMYLYSKLLFLSLCMYVTVVTSYRNYTLCSFTPSGAKHSWLTHLPSSGREHLFTSVISPLVQFVPY